ncbi:unnamed protein product, partial [Pylaiella littoralis]
PFTLRRVSGKSGRCAYENAQKLEVLKFSRLTCGDGHPVGRRGAGKVFGIDKKLIRDWESQEAELVAFSKKENASKQRSLHTGREADTKEVEVAIVDEINTLRKNGAAVTRDLVMAKLLSEMPTFSGGMPSQDEPEKMEKFQKRFNAWYYRFLKRHRFSIRRKTSVGQKKPEGWEGKAWAFIQKLRSSLREHAQEAIFALLYNMDQTPIQAEMPPDTTVEKTGTKSACITTGGETVTVRTAVSPVPSNYRYTAMKLFIWCVFVFYYYLFSWCDRTQSDEWVTQDFMRRPGSTSRDQRPSVLVLDDFRCHREERFQKKLMDLAKTLVVMLGGRADPGVPAARPEHQQGVQARCSGQVHQLDPGQLRALGAEGDRAEQGLVATWVKEVWDNISERTIRSCFKVCGLTLNLDGSED